MEPTALGVCDRACASVLFVTLHMILFCANRKAWSPVLTMSPRSGTMGSGVGDGSVRGRGRTPTGAQASTDFLSHSPLQATLASLPLLKQATHIPTPGLSHSSWNVLSPEAHKYPPSSLKSLLPSCPGHTSVSLPVFNHLPALAWTCPPWHGVLNSVHHYLLGGGCWFTVYVPQPDCRLLKHTLSCSLLHHQHQVRSA